MNSWDPIWESVFQNQEWGKYPGENLIQFVARNFYRRDRKNTSLLEIGCGPGANIWYMAREGFNVFGIDGSKTAVNIAMDKLKKENLNASLKVGDIINLPYENNFFDGVIDNECLYANNEENAKLIVNEINRVMKKDGLFYSRTFSDDMYIGQELNENLEYTNINEGPLKGKGFARLSDINKINSIYGGVFKIVSIDKMEYTQYNFSQKISEFIIICQKM